MLVLHQANCHWGKSRSTSLTFTLGTTAGDEALGGRRRNARSRVATAFLSSAHFMKSGWSKAGDGGIRFGKSVNLYSSCQNLGTLNAAFNSDVLRMLQRL